MPIPIPRRSKRLRNRLNVSDSANSEHRGDYLKRFKIGENEEKPINQKNLSVVRDMANEIKSIRRTNSVNDGSNDLTDTRNLSENEYSEKFSSRILKVIEDKYSEVSKGMLSYIVFA